MVAWTCCITAGGGRAGGGGGGGAVSVSSISSFLFAFFLYSFFSPRQGLLSLFLGDDTK